VSAIDAIIASFNPISLKEMDSVALMNRTDTKYLISKNVAEAVLKEMSQSYRVLQIGKTEHFNIELSTLIRLIKICFMNTCEANSTE